jgi:16S rRNA (cytidine1402-2'-O)-methyltransferase
MTEPNSDDSLPPWPELSPWAESGVAQQEFPAGLYVVATPLGNAADVTLRALWVMRLVDCIACEDTRTTAPLLARFGIHRRLMALHQHNEADASAPILERLARGERVALVSDAGTPAISDPGAALVQACLAAGARVIPVPGASSLTAALCVAGVRTSSVHFAGFAPARGTARQRFWNALAQAEGAVVIFEAPHRVLAAAHEMRAVFAPARRVVVARELTKKFESIVETTIAALPERLDRVAPRGEYVLVVDAATQAKIGSDAAAVPIDAVTARWLCELAKELPASRAAAVAARASGLPRELLYRALVSRDPAAP